MARCLSLLFQSLALYHSVIGITTMSNYEVATSVKAGEIVITEKICVSFQKNNLRVAKLEFFSWWTQPC